MIAPVNRQVQLTDSNKLQLYEYYIIFSLYGCYYIKNKLHLFWNYDLLRNMRIITV